MLETLAFIVPTVLLALQAPSGERVPTAAVVDGMPRGLFVGRSLLTGRAVCLLFLDGGRITRAIPEGGLEPLDWSRHAAAHPRDSGTWQMRGGHLVVAWGDGGVHQGPLTVRADGIEFYGKRYAKPARADLAALAGRWESARGTAIAGGSGIHRVNELVIQPDGRYSWSSTTGGVVSGRAAASDRTASGQVTVRGQTIVFRSDDGTTRSHTFVPVAGTPVTAFSVDSDMFTRTGPAARPAPATPVSESASTPSGSAPAGSYRGLLFTTPLRWTSGVQQGHFLVAPQNSAPDAAVIVVLYGAEPLNGRLLDDWLRTKMAADLGGGLRALQSAPPTRGTAGPLQTLSAGRTVQDQSGGVLLQIYHAISNGSDAGLAMVATASEAGLKTHMPGVQALFGSLGLGAEGSASSSALAGAVAAERRQIGSADVTGAWGHSSSSYSEYVNSAGGRTSSTIAWGDGYELMPDGTYAYLFTGMIDGRYIKERDSGTWKLERGGLAIRSNTGRRPKDFVILSYQVAPDGVVFMSVLDAYYPLTRENIEMYAERWVKKAVP